MTMPALTRADSLTPRTSSHVIANTIPAAGRLTIPIRRCRVVWGLGEVMASFSPTSRFRRVDLPTLGKPMRAI